jgi:uncharacterized protein
MRFRGYAARFDRVDRAGDRFAAGAFAGAGPVPLLHAHRGPAVGRIVALAADATGLLVEGWVDDPAVARLVRARALAGLSVGYRPLATEMAVRGRVLTRVRLAEVSLVAVPMQPAARVEQVWMEDE